MKLETQIQGRPGSIEIKDSKFVYLRDDGQRVEGEFSMSPLEAGASSVLIGGRVYQIRPGATSSEVLVNGSSIAIDLRDPRALRSQKGSASAHGRAEINAPMPGKVVRLLVAKGDTVEAGQGLVVVEAMKMQNEVTSPKTGRVAEVRTAAGSAVAAGEVLMVVE
jgi:biotin carboxyl carrier protein